MLILLAEDDLRLAKHLKYLLGKEGYQVDHAVDGQEALYYLEANDYSLAILDWMMPVMSGIEVCSAIRSKGYQGGILMLTAKDSLDDKIEGLETGADDYLVKPFEFKELLARVKALGRRSSKELKADVLNVGPFSLNRSTLTVSKNGEDLGLSNKEFQIFRMLLENNGQIIPKAQIIDRIWGLDVEIGSNNVESFIRLLRKKVDTDKHDSTIINIRGIGYKVDV